MSAPAPTLRSLAKILGLSRTTVSDALRGSPRVDPNTALRVKKAAREAGYRRNPLAGALMSELRRSRGTAFRGVLAAVELGKHGVRVNAVCPEAGSPEMFRPYLPKGVDPEVAASFQQRILKTQMKRSLTEKMDDVARMICFLVSDESGSCTGTDFLVDGGNLAGTRIELKQS